MESLHKRSVFHDDSTVIDNKACEKELFKEKAMFQKLFYLSPEWTDAILGGAFNLIIQCNHQFEWSLIPIRKLRMHRKVYDLVYITGIKDIKRELEMFREPQLQKTIIPFRSTERFVNVSSKSFTYDSFVNIKDKLYLQKIILESLNTDHRDKVEIIHWFYLNSVQN